MMRMEIWSEKRVLSYGPHFDSSKAPPPVDKDHYRDPPPERDDDDDDGDSDTSDSEASVNVRKRQVSRSRVDSWWTPSADLRLMLSRRKD